MSDDSYCKHCGQRTCETWCPGRNTPTDTERIEWLEKQAHAKRAKLKWTHAVCTIDDDGMSLEACGPKCPGAKPTVREAIDAAMQAEPAGEGQ